MGQILGGGRNVYGSTSMGKKYSVRNIKSIIIIVVYILPSCQARHIQTGPPTSVGRALDSHYAKYATRITLFYQGKIAMSGVHKQIQMAIYPSKGGLTRLLSNVVEKVGVRGCIRPSW